jgi:hypothetical protein
MLNIYHTGGGAMLRIFGVLVSACFILSFSCAAAQAFVLPDTGQTACYSGSSETACSNTTGEDGNYTRPRGYTDHGDGTVTDNVTGLMWQKCTEGQDYDSSGNTCGTGGTTYIWTDLASACAAGFGYSDWRLPTDKELTTLLDLSAYDPAINGTYFPNTQQAVYWTSVVAQDNSSKGWGVSFDDSGTVNRYSKTSGYYARCVRGAQTDASFTDNSDGTVTDNVSGLMWQKCSMGQTYSAGSCSGSAETYVSWTQGISYCESELTLGGYSDWRLPDIFELRSIVDTDTYNPAVSTTYFPMGTGDNYYWSSSTALGATGYAFVVNFWSGGVGYTLKGYTNGQFVRCVRGGESCTTRPVKIGTDTAAYTAIQSAYAEVDSSATIYARAVTTGESLTLSSGKTISLIGGYDCSFGTNSGYTNIRGLTIGGSDTVTVDRIKII